MDGLDRRALARVPDLQLPGSRELTCEDDRASRALMAARPLSHLSHNFLLQKPLFDALADFVHRARAGSALTILVPDLAMLDRESLGLLRTLFRRYPEKGPSLVAGFDPERLDPQPDREGLIWEQRSEEVWRVVTGFLSLPGAEAGDVPRTSSHSRAHSEVSTGPHGKLGPPPADPGLALARVRTAFESFAFESTLRRGLAVQRAALPLSSRQRAELHGLIALAAHNRQFRSLGNRRLAEFLIEHLSLALEAEDRPAERSALCYRLAVAHGRRLKEREAGLDWAERAIDEARRADLPAADVAILEAWGRNIKSFMLTGTGQLDEAARQCQRAYDQLDGALEGLETPLESSSSSVREAAFSRSILADNLGAIYQMTGDSERMWRWKQISDRHNREAPEVERYEARFWIRSYRRQLRLGAARERARRGLDAARRAQDALREYRYVVELADLCYRLREAEEALFRFEEAEALYAQLGSPPFLRPVRLAPASAAARAGRLEEALERIDDALAGWASERPIARAQALALRGVCLARAGRCQDSEASIDAAIELAVSSGERDLLLSVAVSAGRACQHLGRLEQAREAYLQAAAIADQTARDDDPPPAGLELAAHLGLQETGPREAAAPSAGSAGIRRCLELLGDALEDAETWWRIARLEAQLEQLPSDDPLVQRALEWLHRSRP